MARAQLDWPAVCSLQSMEFDTLVGRARNEFIEMPGLQLTVLEAARLWGLENEACRDVIEALVEAEFLRWTPRSTVVRN